MHFLDEVLQHLFRHLKICNHAVFERSDGGNVARRSTQHPFRIYADRRYRFLIIVLPNGNDRGFIQDNAPLSDIYQRVGCSKIDRQVVGK